MLKQISVFVENVAGSLMKVTKELVAEGINLRAISSFDTPEFGILRLIVDRPEETAQLLKDKGFFVQTKDVIAVEIEDRSGQPNQMLEVLAEGNISINYIYFLCNPGRSGAGDGIPDRVPGGSRADPEKSRHQRY